MSADNELHRKIKRALTMHKSEARKVLRRKTLKARDSLDEAQRAMKSAVIRETLLQLDEIEQGANVMIYVNFRSEVETMPLFDMLFAKNVRVTVPLTVINPAGLIPYEITDPQKELRAGYCGIAEPDTNILQPVDPASIDVVLVPGSVFDLHGGRLGYGGGFYDRFLSKDAPQALRVGLAFEMQVVDHMPLEEHDESLHYLVTEKMRRKING